MSAEPEVLVRTIDAAADRFLVLASDGVWEFLTNDSVVEYVRKEGQAAAAAKRLTDEAYQAWMDLDERSDDITAICCFFRGARRSVDAGDAGV